MKLIRFETSNGREELAVYVNPEEVAAVRQTRSTSESSNRTVIVLKSGAEVHVTEYIGQAAGRLQASGLEQMLEGQKT